MDINQNKGIYHRMGLGEFINKHNENTDTTKRVMKKTGGAIDHAELEVEVKKPKPMPKDRELKKNVYQTGGRVEKKTGGSFEEYKTGLNGRPGRAEVNNVGGAPTKAILKKGGSVRREHHDFGEDVGRAKKYAEDTFNRAKEEAPKIAKKVHDGASNVLSKAKDYFHFEEGGSATLKKKYTGPSVFEQYPELKNKATMMLGNMPTRKSSTRENHDMGEMVGRLKSDAEDKFNKVKRGAEDVGNKIKGGFEDVKHGAENAWGKVRKAFHFEEGGPAGMPGKQKCGKRSSK